MSATKGIVYAVGIIFLCASITVISIYVVQPPWTPEWLMDVETRTEQGRNAIEDFIIAEVDPQSIRSYLRYLTSKPHVGGTPNEWETADWVKTTWENQGMDRVHLNPYQVLLSYPDRVKINYVHVLDDGGQAVFTSQGKSKPIYSPEESSPDVLPDFNAYSTPGDVQGDVVYAHFGRPEDFDVLAAEGVDVAGKIVLARYGEIYRGNIADNAEQRGAIGVILYPDPEQFASDGEDNVYPRTVFMPGSGAPSGSVFLGDGDPLTPFFPSVDSAFRLPEEEAWLPGIPTQPICYDDAREILGRMGGNLAPAEWQGGLNVTYRLGPGLSQPGWKVRLEVYTHSVQTTTYNVIGVILGSEEPDRYVVLGNHRDAWIFGAVDPSSGTAAMMELSRVLLQYRNETGWTPKRSIVFCSWGSEEFGLIGSLEWTEQFGKQLATRAVAYLNVDMAIEGNYSLRGLSAPLLVDELFIATAKVPNPDPNEIAAGRITVYDTWVERLPDPQTPGRPRIGGIGAGSDYKGFQHNLGIPCLDVRYTHGPELYSEPLYHTLYETFALVDELYDSSFAYHSAITQLWGILTVDFADAQLLPVSLVEYSNFISAAYDGLVVGIGPLVTARNLTLAYFGDAVSSFASAAQLFTDGLQLVDTSNPMEVRRVNDRLMLVEQAFIDPHGLPGRPYFNHVVMVPSEGNTYRSSAFAGLTDALDGIEDLPPLEQEQRWRVFSEHLAAVTHYVNTAAKVLTDELW